ncbi:MAG: hypothetical protein QOG13_1919 [Sphingomonadales bacterium]|nr:hypothetical protein [Sphingomonadales bacterium]
MTGQALLIALLLAAPASLAAQTEQPRRPMDSNQRRICRTADTIGTRLGRVVRCRTQAEWEQFARENGQVVDRMQRVGLHCKPWAMC